MKNLKKLLKERGIQQSYLYEQLGVTPPTFIYKRKHGTFTYTELCKMLEVLNKVKPCKFEDL